MIHEFKNPIPVIVEGNKEGYMLYVTNSGMWDNDVFTIVLCEGGIIRHYNSSQVRIHKNSTFEIKEN
jgi:hypothetical protein